ncbi:MAG: type II toxin-antitoxin system RelE/ParE family toxin [Elusimicrobia bacterium]|nr:type II toxin-antitoxin system RelE/ParE family toxin [Elusimicrobiota bacterium]
MKIKWTTPALSDLSSIQEYIRRDSEFYAARFVERIIEAVEGLKIFPDIGRQVPEAEEENIRELLFNHYRIMYQVEHGQIYILAIIHGSRDIKQKKNQPWNVV